MNRGSLLQVAGMASLTVAGALVDAVIGFTVGGVCLVLVGVAEERRQRAG